MRQLLFIQVHHRHLLLIAAVFVCPLLAIAQTPADTLPSLQKVTVTGYQKNDAATTIVPAQQLDKEQLQRLNSLSVADAVKFFSGVLVKDYGGIGGLKTVSIRSLGANHTGVLYDGIRLSEAQGGQIDLSKLSLDNIESITLYNSQPPVLLTPARSFASAAILSIKTAAARPADTKPLHIKASVKAGSFGFVNPAATIQYRFNSRFYNSLSTEWQHARGNYPFKAYENNGSSAKRTNTAISAWRAEYDAGYRFNDSNQLRFKAYYYQSERELPGPVILDNPRNGDETLTDRNFFTQASWQKSFSYRSRLLVSAKYSYQFNHYIDANFPNTQGRMENRFHQRETYFSAAYTYQPLSFLTIGYASDIAYSILTRTDTFNLLPFPAPKRTEWLNNLSLQARWPGLELQGNLLSTFIEDKVKAGFAGRNLHGYTPAISAIWQPAAGLPLRIRAFYKTIFRAPTFNDLYYTFVGNTSLLPENAYQYNAGITWQQRGTGFIKLFSITIDAYYNYVKNKIIAVPRENLFQWSMRNIGLADIRGTDITTVIHFLEQGDWKWSIRGAYTYQRALDITDKNSDSYKNQLPYVPKHSGSASLLVDYKKWSAAWNCLLSSYRYRLGDQVQANLAKGWMTNDLSLVYNGQLKKIQGYKLLLELNNLFNTQYEVIKFYPMPRFNYRVGLSVDI